METVVQLSKGNISSQNVRVEFSLEDIFLCADAAEAATRFASEGLRPDVLFADPPRKGLDPRVIDSIAAMGPKTVVYVSCDPGTLARDLKLFAQRGYAAEKAAAVDMFPRTRHVETVVLMSRVKD